MEYDNPSPEYLKGFNYGYMIAQHIPDLAQQVSKTAAESDRFKGLKDGIEQYTIEQSKERIPEWLKKDRLSSLDKNKDTKEKDKDLDKE